MGNTQIAAQMYTVREFTQTPGDIGKTLEKLAFLGFSSVQLSGLGPIDPQDLAAMLQYDDLSVCITHTPLQRILHDTDAVIREHALLGCTHIGLGAMPDANRKDAEGVRAFIREIETILPKLKAAGMDFCYHNHRFEFARMDGRKTAMDILAEETDPELFKFILDTYWVQAGGANPALWIKKLGSRIPVIHYKDMIIADDTQQFAEVGEGNLDWSSIAAATLEAGIPVVAIEQDVCAGDPFLSLKKSLDNINAWEVF